MSITLSDIEIRLASIDEALRILDEYDDTEELLNCLSIADFALWYIIHQNEGSKRNKKGCLTSMMKCINKLEAQDV